MNLFGGCKTFVMKPLISKYFSSLNMFIICILTLIIVDTCIILFNVGRVKHFYYTCIPYTWSNCKNNLITKFRS
jgi:hypothetical protein